jgi:hypothetical protein
MDAIALLAGNALPLWLGIALLLALPRVRAASAEGEVAWLVGGGYLAGAFLLTVWMRLLSLAGIKFGVAAIGLPLAAIAAALTFVVVKRERATLRPAFASALRALVASPNLSGAMRVVWWVVVAWLALRYALLALEVASRPLYPWDAWTQWATKARVWYELGHLVPFARLEAWYAANGAAYFDASPEYPPTMPLLQVWSCVVLGRWDDTLMNWPWWQIAVALTLLVYGGLRALAASAPVALAGAFLVASLPLANVHVALAGYADLPLAAYYTAAALALLRWIDRRNAADAACAILFAIACTQVKNPRLVLGRDPGARLRGRALATLRPSHRLRRVRARRNRRRRARALQAAAFQLRAQHVVRASLG